MQVPSYGVQYNFYTLKTKPSVIIYFKNKITFFDFLDHKKNGCNDYFTVDGHQLNQTLDKFGFYLSFLSTSH